MALDGALLLDEPLSILPGIGPHTLSRLDRLHLKTVRDLLFHYPFRYDDLSKTDPLADAAVGSTISVKGQIIKITNVRIRGGRTLQKATFIDDSAQIEVTWFNQPYLVTTLTKNPYVSLAGKISEFRGKKKLVSPQYEVIKSPATVQIHTGRLVPVYPVTEGITNKWLRARINDLLKHINKLPETLPQETIERHQLESLDQSLRSIHFPKDQDSLQKAIGRLSFEELLIFELAAQARRVKWASKKAIKSLSKEASDASQFLATIPFTLTDSQEQAIQAIVNDMGNIQPMNRLLLGDVGSGKTIVAATAAYLMLKARLKAVFLAPTGILAKQHYETLIKLFEPFGLTVALITSSTKGLPDADLFVGTHALFFRTLPADIGLVIIDEQHRFGVEQRAKLLEQSRAPHVLSMSATPIPRTLTLTLYADLTVTRLTTMPKGRLPIKTWVVGEPKRPGAYAWIKKQIQEEHSQVFVVCPLIHESGNENMDEIKAAETEYEYLQKEVFPDLKIGLVHGQMKNGEKDAVIAAFAAKEYNILVATPVIEVGIDIPGATIMMIEGAERFGLAQLHQLRGRVGRNDKQSYCLLFTSNPNEKVTTRLKHMETTNSGFELAEIDLKLRGPGDIFGTAQTGYLDFKLANLTDFTLIEKTHKEASFLLKSDSSLQKYPYISKQVQAVLAKRGEAN